ncbi:hypothetical protein [Novosphingobium sp.]|jgi:hypothetical protein|uniref:hypothetical protein n=1 Tax=Novosphingobium sp. TaxID=1874826 RepID=UPI002FE03581
MSTAYFNHEGRLMMLVALPGMAPPESAAFTVTVEGNLDPNGIYFDIETNAVAEKMKFPVTFSRNRVAEIPSGTVAIVEGLELVIDDGEIELDANVEGMMSIHLSHLHFRDEVVKVPVGL